MKDVFMISTPKVAGDSMFKALCDKAFMEPKLSKEFREICPYWAGIVDVLSRVNDTAGRCRVVASAETDGYSVDKGRCCFVGEAWYGRKYLLDSSLYGKGIIYDGCDACHTFAYGTESKAYEDGFPALSCGPQDDLVKACNEFAEHWVDAHGDGRHGR